MNNPFMNKSLTNHQEKLNSKELNSHPSTTYEYVTKKRKTLFKSSDLHLQSPKKENPNKKMDKYGGKNLNYKLLIKRIGIQLKHRVCLPKCKIIKVYQPYRTLILRIAQQIKNTAKDLNFWNKSSNKIEETKRSKSKGSKRFDLSLMKKEENNYLDVEYQNNPENEENIKILLNIKDTTQNVNFINEFEDFLAKNNIEIVKETKLPIFNQSKNIYLMKNFNFWKKYINFICLKYQKDITFFNIVNLIEKFYISINNKNDSDAFKLLIKQKIAIIFEQNEINDFLLIHKLKNLDDLFAKYKILDNGEKLEIKLEENCECPTCQNIKEKSNYKESIKFPQSNVKSKDNKITDYYRLSLKLRPSINKSQTKITKYDEDKKILDYFTYTKIKSPKYRKGKDKKERIKSKSNSKRKSISKSKSKSKSKKNKNTKKQSATNKMKEILDLLNIESK